MPPPRRLTAARAVVLVTLVALAIRLWAGLTLPLIIGNDGAGYLRWAQQIVAGQPVDWPSYRTPGYPWFLAALFRLFGTGPRVVVIAQQLLGVPIAAGLACLSARLAGPRHGLAVGLLACADPVYLGLASHTMTESLATFLLLAAAALAIAPSAKPPLLRAPIMGLALACLCLVRPAFQIVLPFFAGAFLLGLPPGASPWRSRAPAALALTLAFITAAAPWLHANSRRGVRGFSASNAVFIWIGMSNADLLTPDAPIPKAMLDDYAASVKPMPYAEGRTHAFLNRWHVFASAERRAELTSWALRSIRRDPLAYLAAVPRALGWQLDFFVQASPLKSELSWMLCRVTADGRDSGFEAPNFNFDERLRDPWRPFATPAGRGPLAGYIHWWGLRGTHLVRVPLFLAALAATAIAIRKRHWPIALTLAGTVAYVGVHAAFLLYLSRFSAPCWIVWYIAPACVVHLAPARRVRAAEPAVRMAA